MAALRTGERDGLTAAGDAGEPEGHSMNGLRSLARWHPSLFGGVIGLCLLANVIVPGLFWDKRPGIATYVALFMAGGLVAQIGIVALWCALGLWSFRWRLLGTSLLTVLFAGSYVAGLRLPDPGGLPFSVALFIIGIAVAGYLAGVASFVLLGRLTGEHLGQRDQLRAACRGDQKGFSIGYLIGFTSLVAVVIATWQAVMPPLSMDQAPSVRELLTASLMVAAHALLSIAIFGCCALFALRIERNVVGFVGLGVCFLLGLPADWILMHAISTTRLQADSFGWLLSFTLGLTCATLGFLWLLRLSNLRLGSSAATHEA